MTVTYTLSVAEARLNAFPKLLLKWRGSIYKLLYQEIAIFLAIFYIIHIIYHYCLYSDQKRIFDKLSAYCDAFTNFIPLSFVLGFYVSMVVARWWKQFQAIPWPDGLAMLISGLVMGKDERSSAIRSALIRYMLTMQVLTFQAISTSVRKRFPTAADLVSASIMAPEELEEYESVDGSHGKWWLPCQWFTSLAIQAFHEGKIKSDKILCDILHEMNDFRTNCGLLFAYDWISIPLVYTQTVTIAVYTYFGAKVVGRQFTESNLQDLHRNFNSYIPFFTLLEFFFFMGWLKVAEQLINPFGEDDDDYDVNWIIDRNLLVCYLIIGDLREKFPSIDSKLSRRKSISLKNDFIHLELPRNSFNNPHMGSTADLNIKRRLSQINEDQSSSTSSFTDVIPERFANLAKYNGSAPQHRAMSLFVPNQPKVAVGSRKLSLSDKTDLLNPTLSAKLKTHINMMDKNDDEEVLNSDEEDENCIGTTVIWQDQKISIVKDSVI